MRNLVVANLLVAVVGTSSAAIAGAQAGSSFLIAGFSYQRALEQSEPGKATLTQLSVVRNQKQREVDERDRELSTRVAAFQRSLGTLNGAQRDEQEKSLARFRLDTERFIQDAQAEFLGIQREAQTAFLAKLQPVLEDVVKTRGIHMVVNTDDRERVLWSSPDIDITNEVVVALNRAK